jgi:hypothetical protein
MMLVTKNGKLGRNWLTWIITLLMFTGVIGVLGWLIWRQREVLLTYSWNIRFFPLLLSLMVYVGIQFLIVFLWSQIIKVFLEKSDYWKDFQLIILTNLGKRIPGTVWYIGWRIQLYRELNLTTSIVSLASGVELAMLIVSGFLVSLLFAISILVKYSSSMWIAGVLVVLCLFFVNPKALKWLIKKTGGDPDRLKFSNMILWVALYFWVWVLGGVMLFCIANTLFPLPISELGFIIGSWSIVGIASYMLLFLPSNLGFTEIGLSLLLSQIMPSSMAVLVAVSSRILTTLFDIFLALMVVMRQKRVKKS